jgi:hypothetical protein
VSPFSSLSFIPGADLLCSALTLLVRPPLGNPAQMDIHSSSSDGPLAACQAACVDTDWSNASPYAPFVLNAVAQAPCGVSVEGARLRFAEGVAFATAVAFVVVLAASGAH